MEENKEEEKPQEEPQIPEITLQATFRKAKGTAPMRRSNFTMTRHYKNEAFLFGGCDQTGDMKDSYTFNIVDETWEKKNIKFSMPFVGHSSLCVHRGLNRHRPLIFAFGGWEGNGYTDKGFLIDPYKNEVQTSVSQDVCIDWEFKVTLDPTTMSQSLKKQGSSPEFRGSLWEKKQYKKVGWCSSVRIDRQRNEDDPKKKYVEKSPYPRRDHSMCLEPSSQKIVLYGGWNSFHWSFDETKFMEVWTLDSNWRWLKEDVKGDIPIARRGHSSVIIPHTKKMVVYGGCSGYNLILDDTYIFDIGTNNFTKIAPKENQAAPKGRAWHTASLIGSHIYYFGGLSETFKELNDLVQFNYQDNTWKQIKLQCEEDAYLIGRFAHQAIIIGTNILIFGGSYHQRDQMGTQQDHLREFHHDLDKYLVIETDPELPLEKNFQEIKESLKEEEEYENLVQKREDKNQPPPIPFHLLNSEKLLEEQSNFLHWNPHIFPVNDNKAKIDHVKKKIEDEIRSKATIQGFAEFEGLEEEEANPGYQPKESISRSQVSPDSSSIQDSSSSTVLSNSIMSSSQNN